MDEAIPAATLIVVRDRPDGPPELLMVERSEGMAFAAGALVFPGGRIDAADAALGSENAGAVAAIRETIEETAVPVGLAPLPARETVLQLQSELAGGGAITPLLFPTAPPVAPAAPPPLARAGAQIPA